MQMDDERCKKCKRRLTGNCKTNSTCEMFCIGQNGIYFNKITNADVIRSMSDEELAEFICSKSEGFYTIGQNKKRRMNMKKWLQSESED